MHVVSSLQSLMDSELGTKSKYSYLAKLLVVQAEQADLMILDLAMDGPAIDHAALVEFLCARHPKRVRAAKAKWESYHDDSLVDKLVDELTGDMERLALRMLAPSPHASQAAQTTTPGSIARARAQGTPPRGGRGGSASAFRHRAPSAEQVPGRDLLVRVHVPVPL